MEDIINTLIKNNLTRKNFANIDEYYLESIKNYNDSLELNCIYYKYLYFPLICNEHCKQKKYKLNLPKELEELLNISKIITYINNIDSNKDDTCDNLFKCTHLEIELSNLSKLNNDKTIEKKQIETALDSQLNNFIDIDYYNIRTFLSMFNLKTKVRKVGQELLNLNQNDNLTDLVEIFYLKEKSYNFVNKYI